MQLDLNIYIKATVKAHAAFSNEDSLSKIFKTINSSIKLGQSLSEYIKEN